MSHRIQGIRCVPQEIRLKLLNLHSLERRRLRGNLIKVFSDVGVVKENVCKILRISNQDRRNTRFKPEKFRFKKDGKILVLKEW